MIRHTRWISILALACFTPMANSGCRSESKRPGPLTDEDRAVRPVEKSFVEGTNMKFKLTTSAFNEGAAIPKSFTGEGNDVSPVLAWEGAPAGTKEFALICDDPDAPAGVWVHWVIYGIPASVRALPEGVKSNAAELREPVAARQGKNSWPSGVTIGYRGPMPPPGHGTHHYHFKLYALNTQLNLPPGADKQQLLDAMKGHMLGDAELVGTYERKR